MNPRGVEVRPGEGDGVGVGVRRAYAATRIVVGGLFACHGSAVLLGWPPAQVHGGPVRVGAWPGWWAALIELGTGLLVAVGWRARPAGLLASGSMAYAYFTVHQPHGLLPISNGGESAAIYSWVFLLVAVVGSGEWSLESALHTRRPVTYVYPGTPGARRVAVPAGTPLSTAADTASAGLGPAPEPVSSADSGSRAASASPAGAGSARDAGDEVAVIPPGVAGPGNGGRPVPGRALRRERKRRRAAVTAAATTSAAAAVGRDRTPDAVMIAAGSGGAR